jgi:hypothetical protein
MNGRIHTIHYILDFIYIYIYIYIYTHTHVHTHNMQSIKLHKIDALNQDVLNQGSLSAAVHPYKKKEKII